MILTLAQMREFPNVFGPVPDGPGFSLTPSKSKIIFAFCRTE
jgi:hypothetical protein